MTFRRSAADTLSLRLSEHPKKLWVIIGPRQVGKTTMVRQVLADRPSPSGHWFVDADNPIDTGPVDGSAVTPQAARLDTNFVPSRRADAAWLVACWARASAAAKAFANAKDPHHDGQAPHFVLVIDEVQRVSGWPALVKGLWDNSTATGIPMHVVLLGSAPMLVQQGLSESLMGRFELIRMAHWSLDEMHEAFGMTLQEYLYFGGYPYAATLRQDEQRWRAYVRDSLISPSIDRDVLQMARVDKPALMRQLFELGCQYSGQIVALTKLVGSLQDAGNITTLTGCACWKAPAC